MTEWADGLTTIVLRWRTAALSIRSLFTECAPPEGLTPDEFQAAVTEQLNRQPELVEAWQNYSYDKRSSPSPYLDQLEVGFVGADRRDVVLHGTHSEACADFLYRETQWVLHGRRVNHG